MKITVPGNLLLFGEYVITYPGGLGIAVATEEKLIVETSPAAQLTISGNYGNESYNWTNGKPFPNPLISHIVSSLKLYPAIHIHLDSSQFYYVDGTKKGYGSSAAITIGLLYALLEGKIGNVDQLCTRALHLHRSFQGGKGSGYDIFTSCMGGVGLFTGGVLPEWKPLDPKLYDGIYLLRGSRSCNTRTAIKQLKQFESLHPIRMEKYLNTSNTLIRQLTSSLRPFHRASLLNRWINRHISQQIEWENLSVKPLGAGGEIGAALSPYQDGSKLRISSEGVQCRP